jgi:hypothetical protein
MWSEELKQCHIEEVCSRRSELKEILVNTFTGQHALGIYPKEDLISTQQKGNVGEGKQVDVKIKRNSEDQNRPHTKSLVLAAAIPDCHREYES